MGYLLAKDEGNQFFKHVPHFCDFTRSSGTFSLKWDNFEILGTGRSDMHCKIIESLLIRYLKPGLNENVGSERLHLYY